MSCWILIFIYSQLYCVQCSGFSLFTGTRTRLWYCISLKGKSRRVGHFLCCDRDVFRGCQCLNLSLNHLVPHYNLPFISATPFLCSFFTLLFQAFVSLPLSSLLLVSFWTKTASVYTTASIQQTDHSAAFPFPIRFYVTKEDICVSWRPDLCTDNSSISFSLLVHFEIIPTFFHTALTADSDCRASFPLTCLTLESNGKEVREINCIHYVTTSSSHGECPHLKRFL